MKFKLIQVPVVGAINTKMYGIKINRDNLSILDYDEMIKYAEKISGKLIGSTIWFEKESQVSMFLLRWQ